MFDNCAQFTNTFAEIDNENVQHKVHSIQIEPIFVQQNTKKQRATLKFIKTQQANESASINE
jgi:hypothetical protein